MTLQLTSAQPSNKKPTMWDALAQATSLVTRITCIGRVDSEHPFTHDFGCQVSSRIARGLGALKNGP
jgi:hypothetical protein